MHKHSLIFDPLGIPSIAPARGRSPMTGIWLATTFTGNLIAGWLGNLWSGMEKVKFFPIIAVLAAVAGVVIASPFNGTIETYS